MTPTRAAVTFGLILALAYAVECAVWPLRRCRCCSGTGRHARKDSQVYRRCRWCRGSGGRRRFGRRFWDRARRAHRDAS